MMAMLPRRWETQGGGLDNEFINLALDLPFQLQLRLGTVAEDGLVASGDTLIPPGAVYFNARCERREDGLGVRLSDGRITVKEEIGANGLFQARGILAEFKIVGTFECTPPVNLGTSVF